MSLIAPWRQTKWLVASSLTFLVPGIYGIKHKLYAPSALLIVTSFVSANYWKNARVSWRRTADLILSKITFGVFAFYGVRYGRHVPTLVAGYSGFVIISYCYYMSSQSHKQKKTYWWRYHVAFHLLLAVEEFMILDATRQNQTKNNLLIHNT